MPNKLVSIEGYILSCAKYQEKDALITLFSKDKLYSVRVRGGNDSSSKNHSATLIFNKVIIDAYESENGYLSASGVKTLINYTSMYEKIEANMVGQLASEIIIKCFQGDDQLPFDYYQNVMKALNDGFDPLTLAFIIACQGIKAGITPEINECVNCGKKTNLVSFSYDEGGFLCEQCALEANYPPKDKDYLKVIRYGFLVKPEQVTRAVLPKNALINALDDTIKALEDQLGTKIKSFDILKEGCL